MEKFDNFGVIELKPEGNRNLDNVRPDLTGIPGALAHFVGAERGASGLNPDAVCVRGLSQNPVDLAEHCKVLGIEFSGRATAVDPVHLGPAATRDIAGENFVIEASVLPPRQGQGGPDAA